MAKYSLVKLIGEKDISYGERCCLTDEIINCYHNICDCHYEVISAGCNDCACNTAIKKDQIYLNSVGLMDCVRDLIDFCNKYHCYSYARDNGLSCIFTTGNTYFCDAKSADGCDLSLINVYSDTYCVVFIPKYADSWGSNKVTKNIKYGLENSNCYGKEKECIDVPNKTKKSKYFQECFSDFIWESSSWESYDLLDEKYDFTLKNCVLINDFGSGLTDLSYYLCSNGTKALADNSNCCAYLFPKIILKKKKYLEDGSEDLLYNCFNVGSIYKTPGKNIYLRVLDNTCRTNNTVELMPYISVPFGSSEINNYKCATFIEAKEYADAAYKNISSDGILKINNSCFYLSSLLPTCNCECKHHIFDLYGNCANSCYFLRSSADNKYPAYTCANNSFSNAYYTGKYSVLPLYYIHRITEDKPTYTPGCNYCIDQYNFLNVYSCNDVFVFFPNFECADMFTTFGYCYTGYADNYSASGAVSSDYFKVAKGISYKLTEKDLGCYYWYSDAWNVCQIDCNDIIKQTLNCFMPVSSSSTNYLNTFYTADKNSSGVGGCLYGSNYYFVQKPNSSAPAGYYCSCSGAASYVCPLPNVNRYIVPKLILRRDFDNNTFKYNIGDTVYVNTLKDSVIYGNVWKITQDKVSLIFYPEGSYNYTEAQSKVTIGNPVVTGGDVYFSGDWMYNTSLFNFLDTPIVNKMVCNSWLDSRYEHEGDYKDYIYTDDTGNILTTSLDSKHGLALNLEVYRIYK